MCSFDEGRIEAASFDLIVVDTGGSVLLRARVQVQKRGSDVILVDKNADENGRLLFGGQKPGEYWIGSSTSASYDIQGGPKKLKIELSLGT
jgi:hypothetical protein